MGYVTAEALLNVWSVRLRMAEDGTTHPTESAKAAATAVVKALSAIEASELIDIDAVQARKPLARFIRILTGEPLAEFDTDDRASPENS